jgi:hypothetical protein
MLQYCSDMYSWHFAVSCCLLVYFINIPFGKILILFYVHPQNCEKRLSASSRLSVSPSVCLHETTRLSLERFSWKLIFEYLKDKLARKIRCNLNRTIITLLYITLLYINISSHFGSYLAHFFLEWQMFETEVVEKIKTFLIFTIIRLCWKILLNRADQWWRYNTAHARCVLDTKGSTHTHTHIHTTHTHTLTHSHSHTHTHHTR